MSRKEQMVALIRRRRMLSGIAVVILAAVASVAQVGYGATYYSYSSIPGMYGDWSDSTMWHDASGNSRYLPDSTATAVVLKWGLDVSSSDPAACNNLYVGGDHNNGGTGYSTELRLLGGSLNVSGSAYIGGDQSGGYMCDIEQFDGTTLTAPSEYVGFDNSVAQYTQTGGLNSVGAFTIGGNMPAGYGYAYKLSAGTLSVGAGGITLAGSSGTSALNLGGGTLQATADFSSSIDMPLTATSTIDTNSHAMTLSGNLSGAGGLTTVGAGTLTLTGGLSYTGLTTVTAGNLTLVGPGGLGLLAGVVSGGGGLDVQGGKTVLDYTSLIGGTVNGIVITPQKVSTVAEIALATSYSNGWQVLPSFPLGSTTAYNDPTHTHALGWTNTVVGGENLLTVMYTLYGDANLDGTVNGGDLNTVLSNFNQTGMTWAQGDFNYDTTVNGADLNAVLSNFNQHVNVTGAVPEPSSLLSLAAGLAVLLTYAWWKRKKEIFPSSIREREPALGRQLNCRPNGRHHFPCGPHPSSRSRLCRAGGQE